MERQAQELSDTWRLGELASEREGLQRESLEDRLDRASKIQMTKEV